MGLGHEPVSERFIFVCENKEDMSLNFWEATGELDR